MDLKCKQLLLVAVAATNLVFAKTTLIAHRGVANPFDDIDLGCITKRLRHIRYPYIQGTIDSVAAAWKAGADVVEIDLRITKDNEVVVFHDKEVSCKTEGLGLVRELKLAQLKKLDLAYNLSADDGKTFPLRGMGKGKLITLNELLKAFPDKRFMLNPKDYDIDAFFIIRDQMKKFSWDQGFLYWGSGAGFRILSAAFPGRGIFIPNHLQQDMCLRPLLEGIWFGHFPESCQGKTIDLSPEHWQQPYITLLIKLAHEHSARVALYATNTRESLVGFNDLVDFLITSEILETGRREVPWAKQMDVVD